MCIEQITVGVLRLFVLTFIITLLSCRQLPQYEENTTSGRISTKSDTLIQNGYSKSAGGEALLLTRYTSFEDLMSVVQIKYVTHSTPAVFLTYHYGSREVTSVLKKGINQEDFVKAGNGNFWERLKVGFRCPYAVIHRNELRTVENLGRRKISFGIGDLAFYDLAETMVQHISDEDRINMSVKDLSEKGYLNTFNHIIAQALMTSMFSETLADFVADVHERYNMPELVTGKFTQTQLSDIETGPVDNYLDMINNEWGQELGKVLRKKYHIDKQTYWTPGLLTDYLNDIQSYHSWVFKIAFEPFRPTDEVVIRFARKMNMVN